MWLHFCFSIVFVHVICTDSVKHDPKNINEHAEAIFAGVIKNISRVNNVLQELISNYEHLQKLYKSQENLESAPSDDEIDEMYKNKNHKKPRAMSKSEPNANRPTPGYFTATQAIWDEDESENRNSDSSESEKMDTEKILENNNKNDKKKLKPIINPKEPAPIKKDDGKPQTAKIIFVDTHNITASNDDKKNVLVPDPTGSKKPKTRYSKISHPQQDSNSKHKTTSHHRPRRIKEVNQFKANEPIKMKSNAFTIQKNTKNGNQDKKVEKKLHSESFSIKNIWDEIINNKPIQLEAHNEVVLKKMDKTEDYEPLFKTRKKGLPILTNETRTSNFKNVTIENDEFDVGTSKEDFQAKVLREAYGDACLKVVIRKCFKACKESGKSVCLRYQCKSTYKEKFNEFCKTGCLLEFDSNYNEALYKQVELSNMSRDGYLRDCLPHIHHETKNTGAVEKSEKPINDSLDFKIHPFRRKNLYVLRSSYEKECQKISNKKCRAACSYAYTNLCDAYTCAKEKVGAYKKACKTKCKSSYGSNFSSSDSSDSLSTSDSDSNSDSDSD